MDPTQWIQVLMTVIFIHNGDVVDRFDTITTTEQCQAIYESAAMWNEAHKGEPDYFNWNAIGVQTGAQIQIRCREAPGMQSANL